MTHVPPILKRDHDQSLVDSEILQTTLYGLCVYIVMRKLTNKFFVVSLVYCDFKSYIFVFDVSTPYGKWKLLP